MVIADPDEICAKFEGSDRMVCKSLLSWVNDGSHFASDDIFVSIDSATVENYLRVFRDVFDKQGHLAHYRMMMGDALAKDSPKEEPKPALAGRGHGGLGSYPPGARATEG